MKVLVCGSRNYSSIDTMRNILSKQKDLKVIVEGGATGADALARLVASDLRVGLNEYKAEWDKYGVAAGPIRNKKMLDENPDIDLVVAFHDNINSSKGTMNMIVQAKKAGKPVLIVSNEGTKYIPGGLRT